MIPTGQDDEGDAMVRRLVDGWAVVALALFGLVKPVWADHDPDPAEQGSG